MITLKYNYQIDRIIFNIQDITYLAIFDNNSIEKIFDKTIGKVLEKIKALKGKKDVPKEDTQEENNVPTDQNEDSDVQEDDLEDED